MGDSFIPTPGGLPFTPSEPATPPPNFEDIGSQIWGGIAKVSASSSWWDPLVNVLVKAFSIVVGVTLGLLLKIFAFIIKLIGSVSEEASFGYGDIVAATLKELFGVDVDPASVNTRRGGADRQAVATKLGQSVIGTLFSAVPTQEGGGITPSSQAADNFLATVMNMEVNGWIESWFTDGLTAHLLEKYGDLKDGISRSLGLGRMARQVFAAPIKILVHDPYLALLYQKYRSKAPDVKSTVTAFFRGEFDTAKLSELLGNQGYTEQEIKWLIADHTKYLGLADVDYLLSRGTWTNDDATHYLQQQGYESADAGHVVDVLNDKRIHKYRTEFLAVGQEAYIKGDIDASAWNSILDSSGLSAEEQNWIGKVAALKKGTRITHLTLGQIETGIKDGIMNLGDLNTWAQRNNMPADEEAYLELMVLYATNKQAATEAAKAAAAKAKATAAQAKIEAATVKAAAAKAAADDKGVSVAQAETLVEDGHWTFDHLTTFLQAKGYGPDAIEAITTLVHDKLSTTAAKTTTATSAHAKAGAKALSIAQATKAFTEGIITSDQLTAAVTAAGYDPADAGVVVSLAQSAKAAQDTKTAAKTAAIAKAAEKHISLPVLERAVRLGLTSLDAYNSALQAAGFDSGSISLLDGLLATQIASDKATAAKAARSATAAASKGVSVPQLQAEVLDGIRPIGDYRLELASLGYSISDQNDLVEMLQLKIDQKAATAAARAAAGKALQARGISLPQAETAVKLGVAPIATYQALLKSNGYTQDAIDVLSNSLLAQVAKTSKAKTTAAGAAAALATKGISLPQAEQAVLAGINPIGDYQALLSANGYSAADQATLVELLQMKLDHAKAAAAKHADAEGLATAKGISLAAEEQAVLAGDKTMDNYDSLLTALGYDAIDRATLESLLQAKIAAKAAKAGASPTPGSGTTPAGG